MLVNVLFRRGQYYTGILLPPGAIVFWYVIAPRQLCTDVILPPGRNQRGQFYHATPGGNTPCSATAQMTNKNRDNNYVYICFAFIMSEQCFTTISQTISDIHRMVLSDRRISTVDYAIFRMEQTIVYLFRIGGIIAHEQEIEHNRLFSNCRVLVFPSAHFFARLLKHSLRQERVQNTKLLSHINGITSESSNFDLLGYIIMFL
jgi:hypothetical protein